MWDQSLQCLSDDRADRPGLGDRAERRQWQRFLGAADLRAHAPRPVRAGRVWMRLVDVLRQVDDALEVRQHSGISVVVFMT